MDPTKGASQPTAVLHVTGIDACHIEIVTVPHLVFCLINIAPSAPPANVSCTAVDESSIHCSWQPPPRKDRNGRIIGYTVRYKAANSNAFFPKAVDASVLSMNLEKLKAYTEYRIDVAAKSSKGQGPFSHHLKITTDETGE